jgi:hypothetical protein
VYARGDRGETRVYGPALTEGKEVWYGRSSSDFLAASTPSSSSVMRVRTYVWAYVSLYGRWCVCMYASQ